MSYLAVSWYIKQTYGDGKIKYQLKSDVDNVDYGLDFLGLSTPIIMMIIILLKPLYKIIKKMILNLNILMQVVNKK